MLIFLDIETLPSADPAVRDLLSARIKPPAAMKKADTIAAWEANDKPALIDEAVSKTSFDGTYGSVCVIGLAFDGQAPMALMGDGRSERDMLLQLMHTIDERCTSTSRPVFVGHNIHGFDLPFLWKRCAINRVKPSPWIPFGVKPWSERLSDTMLMWDDRRDKSISLDALCRVLGVDTPKGDMDGSKVAQAWAEGRYADVAAYCMADVAATRECYKRMRFES